MSAGRRTVFLSALVAAVAIVACGSSSETQPANAPAAATAPAATPVDPATAATITGTVTLEGKPPAADPINLSSDDYCVKQGAKTTRTFVVDGSGLHNVFVYVKDGLGDLKFPVPTTPAVLDQRGCWYEPRVFGIQVGQPLDIVNSDETLHNVHAMPMANREFNRGQALKGLKYTTTFTAAEVMVPFKCDVHKWMNAWIGVVTHPFYATSGSGGTFSLKGLPPGTYTIEAWHEKLGTTTQTVTLGAKETKPITFTFTVS
jgi:plastocyanin